MLSSGKYFKQFLRDLEFLETTFTLADSKEVRDIQLETFVLM